MTSAPIRRLRSAGVALLLAGAATGTTIAVAGPAHAISNSCDTTTTITVNGKTADQVVKWGTSVTVTASVVVGACDSTEGVPTTVEFGTLTIERSTGADGPWTALKSADVGGSNGNTVSTATISGKGFLPGRTHFRAHYTGGSDITTGDTFRDSYDFIWAAPIRIANEIRQNCTATGCTDTWKITPKASISGLRVQIQRKVDGNWTWKASRVVDTSGTFTYTFTRGVTRVLLPAARGYASSYLLITVTRSA